MHLSILSPTAPTPLPRAYLEETVGDLIWFDLKNHHTSGLLTVHKILLLWNNLLFQVGIWLLFVPSLDGNLIFQKKIKSPPFPLSNDATIKFSRPGYYQMIHMALWYIIPIIIFPTRLVISYYYLMSINARQRSILAKAKLQAFEVPITLIDYS